VEYILIDAKVPQAQQIGYLTTKPWLRSQTAVVLQSLRANMPLLLVFIDTSRSDLIGLVGVFLQQKAVSEGTPHRCCKITQYHLHFDPIVTCAIALPSLPLCSQPSRNLNRKLTMSQSSNHYAVALHGGAGAVAGRNYDSVEKHLCVLTRKCEAMLLDSRAALDVVEYAVKEMEQSGMYVAGRGSAANSAGYVELDASIMHGPSREAGAVAALPGV